MAVKYSEADFQKFRKTCEPRFLFCDSKRLAQIMEAKGIVPMGKENKITIDRAHPFNPVAFPGLGMGWCIGEEDGRSVALDEIDLSRVKFISPLQKGEKEISGEEKNRRLRAWQSDIHLDAKIFQTLWEEQTLIPPKWKRRTNGEVTEIYFNGTILELPPDHRYVFSFCWGGREWFRNCYKVDKECRAKDRFAILPGWSP